jgi:hypothetical protein
MAELKEQIEAERDELREENHRLKAQLAAAGRPARANQAEQQFVLSEGHRQELVANGVVNVNGRRMTRADVEEALGDEQQGLELGDAEPADGLGEQLEQERAGIRGFDYVYPSVAPGLIDPAVAGTPGINGPSADQDAR